ncbi:MAG: PspC domain-containing protein, partial [Acidimicrobiales bacterium]
MAEAPDPGTRPLTEGGRPTEPPRGAPENGSAGAAPTAARGWHGHRAHWSSHGPHGPHGHSEHWTEWRRHRDHTHHHVGGRLRHLRRSPDNRVLGGVCGAVSRETGIDAMWVRIGFVLLAIASGVMVFVYAMAWLLIPMEGETGNIYSRAINDRRGIRVIAAVLIPLLIAVSVITSTLHVGFVGFIGWPTFLAIGVFVLIWRNANESEKAFID